MTPAYKQENCPRKPNSITVTCCTEDLRRNATITETYSKNLVSSLELQLDQDQGSVWASIVGDIMWVLISRFRSE